MRHETIYNFFLFDLKTNMLIFLKISLIPIIRELQIFLVHWKDSKISYIYHSGLHVQTNNFVGDYDPRSKILDTMCPSFGNPFWDSQEF